MDTAKNAPIAPEPAAPGDGERVLALWDRAGDEMEARGVPGWRRGTTPREHFARRVARGQVFVLRSGKRVVASVSLLAEDPKRWGLRGQDGRAGYIHTLVRDRERTAPGTGEALLAWAERRIAAWGRPLARLHTDTANPRLLRYYTDRAYHPVGSVEADGTAFTLFEKLLGPEPAPASATLTPPADRHAALAALDARVEHYLQASVVPSTRDKYRRAWEQFESWCALHDLPALPASPRTISRYLAQLAETRHSVRGRELPLSPSWIQLQLAALRLAHEALGFRPAPTQQLEVRMIMRGIRRSLGVAPRSEAAPLSVSQLREMIAATPEGTLRDVRDHLVLLLGFAGALRRSEISGLDWEDVAQVDGGLLLRMRHSKTDPEAQGQEIGVPQGTHQETDPVIALQRWRSLGGHSSGPLFRVVDRRDQVLDQRMSDRAVSRILQRAARMAQLEIPGLSGHSLRAGFATSAAQAGASERAIAQQTRHRSLGSLRRYIRRATLFEENAAAVLGL